MLGYGGLANLTVSDLEAMPPLRRERFVELLRDQKEYEREQVEKSKK